MALISVSGAGGSPLRKTCGLRRGERKNFGWAIDHHGCAAAGRLQGPRSSSVRLGLIGMFHRIFDSLRTWHAGPHWQSKCAPLPGRLAYHPDARLHARNCCAQSAESIECHRLKGAASSVPGGSIGTPATNAGRGDPGRREPYETTHPRPPRRDPDGGRPPLR